MVFEKTHRAFEYLNRLYAIIYGKMKNGLRFIAQNNPEQKDIFYALESQNQVGATVILKYSNAYDQNLAILEQG